MTGGFVYRGKRFPELNGAYIYGDYGTGRVWAAKHDGKHLLWNRELADTPMAVAGFGTNAAGDILIADHLGNAIGRLEPAPPNGQTPQKPRNLMPFKNYRKSCVNCIGFIVITGRGGYKVQAFPSGSSILASFTSMYRYPSINWMHWFPKTVRLMAFGHKIRFIKAKTSESGGWVAMNLSD